MKFRGSAVLDKEAEIEWNKSGEHTRWGAVQELYNQSNQKDYHDNMEWFNEFIHKKGE